MSRQANTVIPAEAGIHLSTLACVEEWIPNQVWDDRWLLLGGDEQQPTVMPDELAHLGIQLLNFRRL
ncbi:hypothetical protein [Hirschia maritima]|uniref:hypothetical protein n=1 Tax=Hirschia maritima TaxID=1121961 RepID=UPI0012DE54EA|nr:hypothetical protein [Hirschia maritima]